VTRDMRRGRCNALLLACRYAIQDVIQGIRDIALALKQ
jgi:hypothetical protein